MSHKVVALKDLAAELDVVSKSEIERFKEAVADGVMKAVPKMVAASPVDTGLYAQSWRFSRTEMSVFLGNYAPHAPIIEHGARPFKPPIAPLLAWAKRVLQDPSMPPEYSDRVWALAKGTQKKIMEQGMVPKKVLESAIPSIIEDIKSEYIRLHGKK